MQEPVHLFEIRQLLYSLVAEATMQACQVESSIAETSAVAFVPVALPLISGQDEAVEIM